MRFLIIETCTERALVAVVEKGHLLFHRDLAFGFHHSRHLLPAVDEALRQTKVDAIAVGVGPGSYTGIRVGAMTAKTLSFASKLPLVGICTLHSFVPSRKGTYAVLIDAKIGGVYVAIGLDVPQLLPVDQLPLNGIETLVTPNALLLKPKVDPNSVRDWEERAPDPLQMALLAQEKWAKGEYTLDGQLDLLYLRKTQAEIERNSLGKLSCNQVG